MRPDTSGICSTARGCRVADLSFSGLDEIIREMDRLQKRTGPTAEKMIKAGAKVMAEYRKQEAEKRGIRDSGDMIKGIKPGSRIENDLGALRLPVYSQGKDKKGVRNAEKEYLEHYGYKDRTATHWIDEAEQAGEGPATDAMVRVWDENMEE